MYIILPTISDSNWKISQEKDICVAKPSLLRCRWQEVIHCLHSLSFSTGQVICIYITIYNFWLAVSFPWTHRLSICTNVGLWWWSCMWMEACHVVLTLKANCSCSRKQTSIPFFGNVRVTLLLKGESTQFTIYFPLEVCQNAPQPCQFCFKKCLPL